MTAVPQEQMNTLKKWFGRFLKLCFVLFAMLAIFVTILANMGGSTPSLKESTEKFIGETFGGKGYVETLVRLSFFPRVGIDVEKVQVLNVQEANATEKPDILAGFSKVQMYMDFWDVVFSNPRFRVFFIEDGFIKRGIFSPKDIMIERAYVDHDEAANEAKIVANGNLGKDDWKLNIFANILGHSGSYEYEIGTHTPFAFEIANLKFSGALTKTSDNFMKLEDFTLEQDDHKISGNLYASLVGAGVMKLKGDIKPKGGEEDNLKLDFLFDFKSKPMKISGTLAGEKFALADVYGEKSLKSLFDAVYTLLRADVLSSTRGQALLRSLSAMDMDVKMNIKGVSLDKYGTFDFDADLNQKQGNLVFTNIKGTEAGAAFNIPSLILVQKADTEIGTERFYMLASLEMNSDIINGEPKNEIFPSMKSGQKLDCMAGTFVFDQNNLTFDNLILQGQDEKKKTGIVYDFSTHKFQKKPAETAEVFSVSPEDYAMAEEFFKIEGDKACLSYFKSDVAEKTEEKAP